MIGGKVLDPAALVGYLDGRLTVVSWIAVAPQLGLVLYVPAPAVDEVLAVRPHCAPLLARLMDHPQVVHGDLNTSAARSVEKLLAEVGIWDGTAGTVVYTARQRGWPVLSGDPERLRRIDPTLTVDEV